MCSAVFDSSRTGAQGCGCVLALYGPLSKCGLSRVPFRRTHLAGLQPPPIWLLDDRIKSMEKRHSVLDEWAQDGGVLIMGYALFVLLMGERASPGGKATRGAGGQPPRKRQRVATSGAASRSARGADSEEVLIGDSDDDPVTKTMVRASYVYNSEDEEEERQVA